ncbi:MAG: hypothetical protein KKD48_04935 [Nanoarchaeota archaeon]|nr:hypothetical protein [Nanoarchaeota archaeon]
MDSYAEEIWRERLRTKVTADRIRDTNSLLKEIDNTSNTATVTRTIKGKTVTYTMDVTEAKQRLKENINSLIRSSPSLQDVITKNIKKIKSQQVLEKLEKKDLSSSVVSAIGTKQKEMTQDGLKQLKELYPPPFDYTKVTKSTLRALDIDEGTINNIKSGSLKIE